ncbi:FCD domain-containing protein [Micromonospora sp. NPDC049060]|uniref:FadR/GntR family transcriptional regulator n=1 Tax=Micromonospora sp. NPDC049060 TaxID=3154828 RepID=UPI0033F4A1CB
MLDDLVATRRVLESDMANVAARLADAESIDRLRALVDRMDELVDDHVTYHEHDRAFHDTVMQASGNRIARGVVQALESQVINTARYMGRTERSLCVASNRGRRRVYERIARARPGRRGRGHVHPHIAVTWLVRRSGSGKPARLQR